MLTWRRFESFRSKARAARTSSRAKGTKRHGDGTNQRVLKTQTCVQMDPGTLAGGGGNAATVVGGLVLVFLVLGVVACDKIVEAALRWWLEGYLDGEHKGKLEVLVAFRIKPLQMVMHVKKLTLKLDDILELKEPLSSQLSIERCRIQVRFAWMKDWNIVRGLRVMNLQVQLEGVEINIESRSFPQGGQQSFWTKRRREIQEFDRMILHHRTSCISWRMIGPHVVACLPQVGPHTNFRFSAESNTIVYKHNASKSSKSRCSLSTEALCHVKRVTFDKSCRFGSTLPRCTSQPQVVEFQLSQTSLEVADIQRSRLLRIVRQLELKGKLEIFSFFDDFPGPAGVDVAFVLKTSPLIVHLDKAAMLGAQKTICTFVSSSRLWQIRHFRPARSVHEEPQAWWRYAFHAALQRHKNDGNYILSFGPQSSLQKVAMVAEYRSLYKTVAIRSLLPASLLSNKALIQDLHLLERELSLDCVQIARYRAVLELLQTSAGYYTLMLLGNVHPSFHSRTSIWYFISDQKTALQAKSTWSWRFRSIDCNIPKLALFLQTSQGTDLVADHELSVELLQLDLHMHKEKHSSSRSSFVFEQISMVDTNKNGEEQSILEILTGTEGLGRSLFVAHFFCTECQPCDYVSEVSVDVSGFPFELMISNAVVTASQDIADVMSDVFMAFSLPPTTQSHKSRTSFQLDFKCDGEMKAMLPYGERETAWLLFCCRETQLSYRELCRTGRACFSMVSGQDLQSMPKLADHLSIHGWNASPLAHTSMLSTTLSVFSVRHTPKQLICATFLESVSVRARTLTQDERLVAEPEGSCSFDLNFPSNTEQGFWNHDLGFCSTNIHLWTHPAVLRVTPDLLRALHDCASNLLSVLESSALGEGSTKSLLKRQTEANRISSFSIYVDVTSISVCFADEDDLDFCSLRVVNIRAHTQVQGSRIRAVAQAAGVFVEGVPGAPSCLLRPNRKSGEALKMHVDGRKTKRRRPPSPPGGSSQFLKIFATADAGIVSTKVQLAGIWLLADPKFLEVLLEGCFLYLDLCRKLIANLQKSVSTTKDTNRSFDMEGKNNVCAKLLLELSSLEILLLDSAQASPPRSPGTTSFTLYSGKVSWQLNKDWYELENYVLVDDLLLCSDKDLVLMSVERSSKYAVGDGSYAGKVHLRVSSCENLESASVRNFAARQDCSIQVHVSTVHLSYDQFGLEQMYEIFVFFRESVCALIYNQDGPWSGKDKTCKNEQRWKSSVQLEVVSARIPKSWRDEENFITIAMEGIDGTYETCSPQLHIMVRHLTATFRTADFDDTVFMDSPSLELSVKIEEKRITVGSNAVQLYFDNEWICMLMWLISANSSSSSCECTHAKSHEIGGKESHASMSSRQYADTLLVDGQSVRYFSWSIEVSIAQANAKIAGLKGNEDIGNICNAFFTVSTESFNLTLQKDSEKLLCTASFEQIKLWYKQASDVDEPQNLLLECPEREHSNQGVCGEQRATGSIEPSKFSFSWLGTGVQVIHFVLSHSCTFYMSAEELVSLHQLWELLQVFTSYEVPEHVLQHAKGNSGNWVHLNVVLERCSVLLRQSPNSCVPSGSSLVLHGQQLYVNYSWDRGSNAVTKVILNGFEGLVQRGCDPGSLSWDSGMLSCLLPSTILFERTWTTCSSEHEPQVIDEIKVDAAEGVIWPEALSLLQPLVRSLLRKWSVGGVQDGVDAEKGFLNDRPNNIVHYPEESTNEPVQYTFLLSLHAGTARLVDSAPAGRPLIEMSLDDLQGEYKTGRSQGDLDAKIDVRASGRMFDDLGDIQPLMDPWHILLQKKCSQKSMEYLASSDERLNLLLSPRLLHILSSLEYFVEGWKGNQVFCAGPSNTSHKDVGNVEAFDTQHRLASKAQRPWILLNETGVRLWFWNESLGEKSRTYAVKPGEAQSMPWTHKSRSTARPPVLSVQLDGAWAPLRGLCFSATGQHIAVLARSLAGLRPVPLIADMPGGRQLRLRSPLRIRNCTTLILSLRLQNADGGPNIEEGNSTHCKSFGFLHPGKFASVPLTALSVNTVAFLNVHLPEGGDTGCWTANDGLWLGSSKGKLDDLKGLMVCTPDPASSHEPLYLTINTVESHRVPWMAESSPCSDEGFDDNFVGLLEMQVLPPLVVESRLPDGYMLGCSFISNQPASHQRPAVSSSQETTKVGKGEYATNLSDSLNKMPNVFPRTFKRISSKTVVENEVESMSVSPGVSHAKGIVSGYHIYRFDVKHHTIRLLMTLNVPQMFHDNAEESSLGFQMGKPVRVIAPKTKHSLQRAVPKRRKVELVLNRGTAALETTRKWAVLAVDIEQVVHGALSYRVAISAPYLLANHTPIPVSFRTYKAAVKGQSSIVTVPPCDEIEGKGWRSPAPALFYSKDKRVLLKVGNSSWSLPFEIDKVGLDCVLRLPMKDKLRRAYDVGLGISWIKSSDGRRISRLITISPAVVLKNCSGKPMKIVGSHTGQVLVTDGKVLPMLNSVTAEDVAEVSLPREEMEGDLVVGHRFLSIKPDDLVSAGTQWTWSEPFRINTPGDQTLRLCAQSSSSSASKVHERQTGGDNIDVSENALLDVHVEFVSASLVVTLGPLGSPRVAPYRISNACGKMRLKCYQKGLSNRSFQVGPLSSVDYAWDAPLRSRRLKVAIQPSGCSQVFTREYELDEIATRPSIIVKYKQQVNHKGSNTTRSGHSGRQFSRVASMSYSSIKPRSEGSKGKQRVTRGHSEPRGILTSGKTCETPENGQKQHSQRSRSGSMEITEVFSVRVFASGSTRVLEFSDLASTLSQDRNEEARLLASKFEKVQQRIACVDQALHQFNVRNEQMPGSNGAAMDISQPAGLLTPGNALLISAADRFSRTLSVPKPTVDVATSVSDNSSSAWDIASLVAGGELRVLVCAVDGFREGSPVTRTDKPLTYVTNLSRLRPFVRVICGKQQRQTWAHKSGQNRPSGWGWDEELVFHGVAATDTIRVEVLDYNRKGDHGFLGEAFVDLAPYFQDESMEQTPATSKNAEPGSPGRRANWFTLTSRGASRNILYHGRVGLALSWNRSLLEQLTLALKAKESELQLKESILSELQDANEGALDASLAAKSSQAPGSIIQGEEEGRPPNVLARWTRRRQVVDAEENSQRKSAADFKSDFQQSKEKYNKILVRVIEARGLKPPEASFAPSQSHSDSYVRVILQGVGFRAPVRTRTVHYTNDPAWNESFSFSKVDKNSSIKFEVFRRNKLGKDNKLGKASVDISKLPPKVPHYLCLPLSSKRQRRHPTERAGGAWLGELRVRIQCIRAPGVSFDNSMKQLSHANDAQEEEGATFSLRVEVPGIGLSLAEGAAHPGLSWSSGHELLHLYIGDCDLQLSRVSGDDRVRLTVKNLQLDNQLFSAQDPVILYPTPVAHQENSRPVLEISFVKSHSDLSAVHFRYLSFLMQELDIHLEETWLDQVSAFVLETILVWKSHSMLEDEEVEGDATAAALSISRSLQTANIQLALEHARASPPQLTQGRRQWYVELLHIHPIKVNVTVRRGHALGNLPLEDGRIAQEKSDAGFSALTGFPILSISNAPVRLDALLVEHVFEQRAELIAKLHAHYRRQILVEIYKVIGSAAAIGSPVAALADVGTGVTSLFYEPARGFVQRYVCTISSLWLYRVIALHLNVLD